MSKKAQSSQHRPLPDLWHLIQPYTGRAPWVMRLTEHRDRPVPVLVVKRRCTTFLTNPDGSTTSRQYLQEQGLLYGAALRRCLPVIMAIVGRVCNEEGIPLELHRVFQKGALTYRGNLPLDEEAGAKLALICRLQERVKDLDRVELIARRVERFSREEAAYWLTRATQYGADANRWALAGLRIMLGGQPGDKAVQQMLEKMRR